MTARWREKRRGNVTWPPFMQVLDATWMSVVVGKRALLDTCTTPCASSCTPPRSRGTFDATFLRTILHLEAVRVQPFDRQFTCASPEKKLLPMGLLLNLFHFRGYLRRRKRMERTFGEGATGCCDASHQQRWLRRQSGRAGAGEGRKQGPGSRAGRS